MNKSELDQVWHSVTSALEKEFWTRGWLSPQDAHIEQLEAALRLTRPYIEMHTVSPNGTMATILAKIDAALAEKDK
jgi:hypothetical protein